MWVEDNFLRKQGVLLGPNFFKMDKTLLTRLDRMEQLARASRWRRLFYRPFVYVSAILYRGLLYPLVKKEWYVSTRTFFGAEMKVALPAATELALLGAKSHDSEIRLTRFLLGYLQPGQVFVDVGGHFGFYTLLAAHLIGEEGSVFTFEAAPRVFQILKANAQALPQIEVFHQAVSETSGSLVFYEFPLSHSEYNTLLPAQFERSDWFYKVPHQKVEVPSVCLDEFFSTRQLQPNFIKIDVEGAEFEVIKGAVCLLKQYKPVVAMEFLAAKRGNAEHHHAMALLKELGYQPYCIDEEGELQSCPDIETHLAQKGLDSDNIVFMK